MLRGTEEWDILSHHTHTYFNFQLKVPMIGQRTTITPSLSIFHLKIEIWDSSDEVPPQPTVQPSVNVEHSRSNTAVIDFQLGTARTTLDWKSATAAASFPPVQLSLLWINVTSIPSAWRSADLNCVRLVGRSKSWSPWQRIHEYEGEISLAEVHLWNKWIRCAWQLAFQSRGSWMVDHERDFSTQTSSYWPLKSSIQVVREDAL